MHGLSDNQTGETSVFFRHCRNFDNVTDIRRGGLARMIQAMRCPLCGQRKPRRACPALGETICSVCCGTKRLVEISCPPDCPHLTTAREHPAAVVRRQQEQDFGTILPDLRELSQRQYQLFFLLQSVIARHTPDGLGGLTDLDVAEAAASVAATYETTARGVIYDHVADSLPARHLAADIKAFIGGLAEKAGPGLDREATGALRAIEQGARRTGQKSGREYLELVGRLLRQSGMLAAGATTAAETQPRTSGIVTP